LLIFVFVAGLDTNRGCSATDVVSQWPLIFPSVTSVPETAIMKVEIDLGWEKYKPHHNRMIWYGKEKT
jgi:hypothetical protein